MIMNKIVYLNVEKSDTPCWNIDDSPTIYNILDYFDDNHWKSLNINWNFSGEIIAEILECRSHYSKQLEDFKQKQSNKKECPETIYSHIWHINKRISIILPVSYHHSRPTWQRKNIPDDIKKADYVDLIWNKNVDFDRQDNYYDVFPGRENWLNVNWDKMPFTAQLFNFKWKEEKDI